MRILLPPAKRCIRVMLSIASVRLSVCQSVCASVSVYVCLSNFWKSLPITFILVCRLIFKIVSSSAYIKVIEPRSRSQEQDSTSVYPLWSVFNWTAILYIGALGIYRGVCCFAPYRRRRFYFVLSTFVCVCVVCLPSCYGLCCLN